MKNTLLMRTGASYSLNFLVYIQNIFLNQSQGSDELKFPYTRTKCEFQKDFEMHYRELWDELSKRITEHPINDQKIFTEEKNLFYQGLFVENDDTLNEFNEIYQSFKVWWNSFAGSFSVERSIDEYSHEIYVELSNLLIEKRIKPKKELEISLIYDYIFVNTDINTVYTKSEIFNIGEKVFIVHDFMPTKINSAKQILLKFEEVGINTKGNISLIYNKMIKCCFNIEFIEEKIIFKKLSNKSLVPLVDLDCETFEIPYSKKTMGAMINHISHKKNIINNVSYSYRRNTDNIYKYMNNIPYMEIDNVNMIEYVKDALNDISQHAYIKNVKETAYKWITYLKNSKKGVYYLIHSKLLEKHY